MIIGERVVCDIHQVPMSLTGRTMETKSARLTVLIDPNKKQAFEQLCASQDITPSQVVRQLIRDYLDKHGVEYGQGTPIKNPQVKS
jgi:hypothetical protein